MNPKEKLTTSTSLPGHFHTSIQIPPLSILNMLHHSPVQVPPPKNAGLFSLFAFDKRASADDSTNSTIPSVQVNGKRPLPWTDILSRSKVKSGQQGVDRNETILSESTYHCKSCGTVRYEFSLSSSLPTSLAFSLSPSLSLILFFFIVSYKISGFLSNMCIHICISAYIFLYAFSHFFSSLFYSSTF